MNKDDCEQIVCKIEYRKSPPHQKSFTELDR